MRTRLLTRIRSVLWITATVALVASACSIEDVTSAPDCQAGGSVFLVAQSVPTADFVPCFYPLPAGWEVDSVKIDQDGTTIRLDSDRAGDGAAVVRFRAACELGSAVEVSNDQDGVARFQNRDRDQVRYRSQRYYVFAGGCVWWEFDFAEDARLIAAIEVAGTLSLFTRDFLNQSMRENFIDESL